MEALVPALVFVLAISLHLALLRRRGLPPPRLSARGWIESPALRSFLIATLMILLGVITSPFLGRAGMQAFALTAMAWLCWFGILVLGNVGGAADDVSRRTLVDQGFTLVPPALLVRVIAAVALLIGLFVAFGILVDWSG